MENREHRGEVTRLVELVTDKIRDLDRRVTSLELNNVRQDQELKHVTKALEKIEANTTWTVRLIVGGLVTGAIGLLYTLATGG